MNPTQNYRCKTCGSQWTREQVNVIGIGPAGLIMGCPQEGCTSAVHPITEPTQNYRCRACGAIINESSIMRLLPRRIVHESCGGTCDPISTPEVEASVVLNVAPGGVPESPVEGTGANPPGASATADSLKQAFDSDDKTGCLNTATIEHYLALHDYASRLESALTASREECEKLREKLIGASGAMATIASLNKELTANASEIAGLRKALALANQEIVEWRREHNDELSRGGSSSEPLSLTVDYIQLNP